MQVFTKYIYIYNIIIMFFIIILIDLLLENRTVSKVSPTLSQQNIFEDVIFLVMNFFFKLN